MIDRGGLSLHGSNGLHVYGIFEVGLKAKCDQLCEDLNRLVPINNLGELRLYSLILSGCQSLLRDWVWYFDDLATSYR